MSNSPLVQYTKISPNQSSRNGNAIDKITVHHMAGVLSVETCGNIFAPSSRQASSNYGIGSDARVAMYVEEKNRAWTSSNAANDRRAVTIEVSNDSLGPNWTVSQAVWDKLVLLCVDICQRNGIKELVWTGDTRGNLTTHDMFANTNCPGPYIKPREPELAAQVNAILNGEASVPGGAPASIPSNAPSVSSAPTPTSNFGGVYKCTNAAKPYLNVRTDPGTSAPLRYWKGEPVRYKPGMTVKLDDWYVIKDGYVWGRYTGAQTGQTNYVAVGKATGKPESDDFLIKI